MPPRALQLIRFCSVWGVWTPATVEKVVHSVDVAYTTGLPVTYIHALLVVAHEQHHLATPVFVEARQRLEMLSRRTQATQDVIALICALSLLALLAICAVAIGASVRAWTHRARRKRRLCAQREQERINREKYLARREAGRARRREEERQRCAAERQVLLRELMQEENRASARSADDDALNGLRMSELVELERNVLGALSRIQDHREARRVEEAKNLECIVCMDSVRHVVFMPCGHFVACANCAEKVDSQCPKCRGVIERFVRTFD